MGIYTALGSDTAARSAATRSEPSVAEVKVELDLEYYQGPEDFFPLETPQLAGIDVTINMPDGAPEPLIAITLSGNPMFVKPMAGRAVRDPVKGTFCSNLAPRCLITRFGAVAYKTVMSCR